MTLPIDIYMLAPAMREAGAAILQIKKDGVQARYKADASPVTLADTTSESILKQALSQSFADIPVISEENTHSHFQRPEASYFLVDPLDGTREFLREDSNGHFTVNIGWIEKGQARGGIVYVPEKDWLCWTDTNQQAWQEKDGVRMPLAIRKTPASGPAAVASRSHRDNLTEAFLKAEQINTIISAGSSLKFLMLAAGQADIYPRFGPTMEWDTAAGEAILRAAGGGVYTSDGQPHNYGKPGWKNKAFMACAGYVPSFFPGANSI